MAGRGPIRHAVAPAQLCTKGAHMRGSQRFQVSLQLLHADMQRAGAQGVPTAGMPPAPSNNKLNVL